MADIAIDFVISKVHEDQRLVSGLAMVSRDADGKVVTDLQGDQIEPEELELAFVEFALESRAGDVMHDKKNVSRLVEMLVITPAKLGSIFKAFGRDAPADFQGVGAWVTFKVDDEATWQRVKGRELRAFSIEGSAEVV